MASSALHGGTFASAADTGSGTTAWVNPGNAVSSNNTYATCALELVGDQESEFIKITNFGFSIPAGAIIGTISAAYERKADASGITDFICKLIVGGSLVGNNMATGTAWPTSESAANPVTFAAGSRGYEPTAAEINASTFGVALCIASSEILTRTASLDDLILTVNYEVPATRRKCCGKAMMIG